MVQAQEKGPNAGNTSITGQSKVKNNYISTGMPILLIAPDAISSALGDAGVASTPDANSAHWNNAKFVQSEAKGGITTTYTPWLRHLGVSDMNLLYLGGYYKINKRHAVGASVTYFSLGELQSTDEEGNDRGTFKPNEFALDATYSLLVADGLSIGASFRYIRSDISNGMDIGNTTTKAANSFAADIGIYYNREIDQQNEFAVGGFISNLGAKLSYSDDDTQKEFLPTNLRLGARYTYHVDNYNKLNVLFDINKLLVPTPPLSDGSKYYANRTEYNQTNVIKGAIQSFYDAPGGFKEEMQEIQLSLGAEYWYSDMFAARLGYFYENKYKGGRQYLSVGAGIRYNVFGFDFSYLIPTTTISNNPLTHTVRISLSVDFGVKRGAKKD
jgi:hypothetical protein